MDKFAFKNQAGDWVEIFPGVAFTLQYGTEFVPSDPTDDTNPDMVEVPSFLQFPPGWIERSSDEDKAEFGIVKIVEPAMPTDPLAEVTDRALIDVEGVPTVQWMTRNLNLGEVKGAKLVKIEQQFGYRLMQGFPLDAYGFAGERLQMRGAEDQSNWLTVQNRCRSKKDAGNGTQAMNLPPRTQDNNNLTGMTYVECDAMLEAFTTWGENLMKQRWALKDAVDNATTIAAVQAVNEAAGWPA